jgi:hypothetical protein
MASVDQTLAHMRCLSVHLARSTEFHGFGPASISASGVIALGVSVAEWRWPTITPDFRSYLLSWILTAAVSVALTTSEALHRARRLHSALANKMLLRAAGQFLPPIFVGMVLTAVLVPVAPQNAWMLPGLWQLLFSLGVFASSRHLPGRIFVVGIWYTMCGTGCLVVGAQTRALFPWEMGIPFGLGQLLVAGVLHAGYRDAAPLRWDGR